MIRGRGSCANEEFKELNGRSQAVAGLLVTRWGPGHTVDLGSSEQQFLCGLCLGGSDSPPWRMAVRCQHFER